LYWPHQLLSDQSPTLVFFSLHRPHALVARFRPLEFMIEACKEGEERRGDIVCEGGRSWKPIVIMEIENHPGLCSLQAV